MSNSRKGKPFPNWGGKTKLQKELTKKKIAEKTRQRMTGSKLPLETRKKLSNIKKGIPKTDEHKRKLSESLKGRKHTPERKEAIIDGLKKAKMQIRKTRPEIIVEDFLSGYSNTWKYTGNKKFWLTFRDGSHKNPDFVNRYTKKAIEVFGNYWHVDDNPQELVQKYNEIGWECLVLTEDEINNNSIIDKFESWAYPMEYYGD